MGEVERVFTSQGLHCSMVLLSVAEHVEILVKKYTKPRPSDLRYNQNCGRTLFAQSRCKSRSSVRLSRFWDRHADPNAPKLETFGGFQKTGALFKSPYDRDHNLYWDLFRSPLFVETSISLWERGLARTASGIAQVPPSDHSHATTTWRLGYV